MNIHFKELLPVTASAFRRNAEYFKNVRSVCLQEKPEADLHFR